MARRKPPSYAHSIVTPEGFRAWPAAAWHAFVADAKRIFAAVAQAHFPHPPMVVWACGSDDPDDLITSVHIYPTAEGGRKEDACFSRSGLELPERGLRTFNTRRLSHDATVVALLYAAKSCWPEIAVTSQGSLEDRAAGRNLFEQATGRLAPLLAARDAADVAA